MPSMTPGALRNRRYRERSRRDIIIISLEVDCDFQHQLWRVGALAEEDAFDRPAVAAAIRDAVYSYADERDPGDAGHPAG